MPELAKGGVVSGSGGFVTDGKWIDAGTPEATKAHVLLGVDI